MEIEQELLPKAIDSERTILGALMVSEQADFVRSRIGAAEFSLDAHARIFRAIDHLAECGESIDLITVTEELRRTRDLDRVGGVAYCAMLTEGLPRNLALDDYCRIVKEKAQLRRVISTGSEMITRAADMSEEASEILSRAQAQLEALSAEAVGGEDPLVRESTAAALEAFERGREGGGVTFRRFGHEKLDELTGGLRDGENTVVGARSGVGKTTLACQIIHENCPRGIPIDLFSLEQTRDQILWHLWSLVSGVPFVCIYKPQKSSPSQAQLVREAARDVALWPLRIHDREELTIGEIVTLARLSIHKHGCQIVIVDYAQNAESPGRDERAKVTNVSKRLTRMIKHEPASLVLLSQLRKVDRKDYSQPPHISDLRETGQLENDAHTVILIHRPWDEEKARIADEGEFIVPKQRFGETGAVPMGFNRRVVRFEEATTS